MAMHCWQIQSLNLLSLELKGGFSCSIAIMEINVTICWSVHKNVILKVVCKAASVFSVTN